MNLVAAMAIYAGILFVYGEQTTLNEHVRYGYMFSDAAKELGFEDRDRILTIDNKPVEKFEDVAMTLLLSEADRKVEVLRDGNIVNFTITKDDLIAMREKRTAFCAPIQRPYIIDGFANEEVEALGYKQGDQIVGVGASNFCDCMHMLYEGAFITSALEMHAGETIDVRVLRYVEGENGLTTPTYIDIATPINSEGKIGVLLQPTEEVTKVRKCGFFESIPKGFMLGIKQVKSYWNQLVMMVNPDTELYKEVGGFISIGSVFPNTWNWFAFWNITALISVMLAVMNLLPIPVLDGGHVLFALYEIITRRKPSEKFLEVAQTIGFALLMLLLIYANGSDIFNLFK
jgi:regulator of sigma E protease